MLGRLKASPMGAMTPPRPVSAAAAETTFASQCLSEFLGRLGRIDTHPAVLDLGVLCGANIAFLGAKGCRVSVESLPRASSLDRRSREEAEAGALVPLPPLSYPPESFAGVLAWNAISRMPSEEAVAFVETLRRLLMIGGVVLAYFPGPPGNTKGTEGRYRIVSEDHLRLEPTHGNGHLQASYQNREIYGLFSRFEVVRLSHLKSGTREVLVAKTRRSGRR